jgi:hypothetical protein
MDGAGEPGEVSSLALDRLPCPSDLGEGDGSGRFCLSADSFA